MGDVRTTGFKEPTRNERKAARRRSSDQAFNWWSASVKFGHNLCLRCFERGIIQKSSSSPTGDWCPRCGKQDPCPCWNKEYCAAHDATHVHQWDESGCCIGPGCGARKSVFESPAKGINDAN